MPNPRPRRNDGFYFVVVDGVPQYCQWQELKDYLRDSAKVRPGHTNVVKVNEDGTRVGFCPLPNKSEANRAFEYLVAEGWRGLNIRVSLVWKSDLGSDDIERRRGPEQSRRRRLPVASTLPFPSNLSRPPRLHAIPASCDTSSIHSSSNSAQAMTMPGLPRYTPQLLHNGHHVSQSISGVSIGQIPAEKAGRHKQNNIWSRFSDFQPMNPTSASMGQLYQPVLPVNVNYSAIHISRLPFEIQHEELNAFLRRCGFIAGLNISRTKDQRCFATATFQTTAEASRAVQELNGRYLGDRKLAVQYARSETDSGVSGAGSGSKGSDSDSSGGQRRSESPTGNAGPLIVNGAMGPGYRRKKKRDDDSESLEEASSADEGRCRQVKVKSPRSTPRKPGRT